MTRWLIAFAFTQLVEIPLYVVALGDRRALHVRALMAFVASALTHPIVWFVFPRLGLGGLWRTTLAAEAFAIAAEALYLWGLGVRWPLAWSAGVNGLSAGLGIASRILLGVP